MQRTSEPSTSVDARESLRLQGLPNSFELQLQVITLQVRAILAYQCFFFTMHPPLHRQVTMQSENFLAIFLSHLLIKSYSNFKKMIIQSDILIRSTLNGLDLMIFCRFINSSISCFERLRSIFKGLLENHDFKPKIMTLRMNIGCKNNLK